MKANAVVPVGNMDPAEAAPLTDAGLGSFHAVKRVLHQVQDKKVSHWLLKATLSPINIMSPF